MKTERRHELQTNTLAITLAQWIEAAKPYSRAALALLVALVVALFSWSYLSHQNTRRLADGWNEYFDAMSEAARGRDPRERLGDISQQYGGTLVGQWARLTLADLQLSQGTDLLFREKKEGRDELKQAADKYQTLLVESREPAILPRATYGLARAHEALGALDKARDDYRAVAKTWPESPFAAPASARADDLDRLDTKNFYDWFAKYEPPRAMTGQPGIPGARPDFMKDPLEGGGITLPALSDDKAPRPDVFAEPQAESSTDKTGEPSGDEPADPAAEKAVEPTAKPATDKPGAEKPGEQAPETK